MNGAQALLRTLAGCGVRVCFANPGTSEMHFVAALDAVPEVRGVLCLFEGVATGAADGYGRMAGAPAAALLHLGPGLANGLANLHNARRARTPLLAVVGDHASYHKRLDAPLESDIDALAGTVSIWARRTARPADVGADAVDAVAAAMTPPGGVATLILPADVSWSPGAEPADPIVVRPPAPVASETIESVAAVLRNGEPCVILLGDTALRRTGLEAASALACAGPGGHSAGRGTPPNPRWPGTPPNAGPGEQAPHVRLLVETFAARHERGAGIPAVERLAYLAEFAAAQLAGARHLILAGARSPVSFFAYPGQPGSLVPPGCQVHVLAAPGEDVIGALSALAYLIAPNAKPAAQPSERPALPDGDLDGPSAAAVIGALLPEAAIVCDEANTSGLWLAGATAGAPPHNWLSLTGGAIGQGLPLATGAAMACPDSRVIALEADGSAMYTISALWTHAREQLNITTVIFSNRKYAILGMELGRVGAVLARGDTLLPGGSVTRGHPEPRWPRTPDGPEPPAGSPADAGAAAGATSAASSLIDLSRPDIDFVALATGMGVPASRARTAAEFAAQLRHALAEPGPHLIDVILPPAL